MPSAAPAASSRLPLTPALRNLLLTLPFLLLFYVQLAHHALWRDELNAWGLAAASPGLGRLFYYIHYEGHPWLWYFLLWLVSKVTVYPVGLKWVAGLFGTGTLLMLGLRSPFTRWQKVLLFLSYFVTFEYTVLSRMYGVILFLLLVYLDRRSRHPERVVGNAALLGLIASLDVTGILLAGGLAVEYLWWLLQRRAGLPAAARGAADRRVLLGLGVFVALLGFSLWTLKLSPDISWRTTGPMFGNLHDHELMVYTAVCYLAMPYLPVLTAKLHYLWNPGPWDHLWVLPMLPFVVWVYWRTFWHNRRLFTMLFVVCASATMFGEIYYRGYERHYGVTFLGFVAALWLLVAEGGRLRRLPVALLMFSAVGGILMNMGEWRRPWSNAETTVAWLQQQGLADVPMAGTADTSMTSIGELLHRQTWQLDCNCEDWFMLFSRRRDGFRPQDGIPEGIVIAREHLGPRMLYFGVLPLTPVETARLQQLGLQPTLIKSFLGAEVKYEDYYIYSLQSIPPAGGAPPPGASARVGAPPELLARLR